MSLLLEALRKAEQAKQGATAQGDVAADSSTHGASMQPEADASAADVTPESEALASRPLITRDRLPDITQPLEILTDDLPSGPLLRTARPMSERAAPTNPQPSASPPRPERSKPREDNAAETDTTAQERNTARQLFEAKATEYNPRRPFYITLGVLGVVIVGAVGYFWYQLQPPRSLYAGAPASGKAAPSSATPVAAEPVRAPMEAQAAPPSSPATTGVSTIVNEAPTGTSPQPQAPPPQATSPVRPTAPARAQNTDNFRPAPNAARPSSSAPAVAMPAAPRQETARAPLVITKAPAKIDPTLERAYDAFERGDFSTARQDYQRVLAAEPLNRDALLGLAAIDLREQRYESAESRYVKLLEIDPRDMHAQAGLISMRGQADAIGSESRLKNLLAAQPDATFLNFTLGNQYAAQRRWPEAQQAYFKAYAADPENPDYAFNLAVSLDHLRQPKLALEYYQKALALATRQVAAFSKAQADARIRELSR